MTTLPKSPTDAIQTGSSKYFTGKPCKNGHVAQRLVGNRQCTECAKAFQADWRRRNKQYFRDWSMANPEKQRTAKVKYRKAHPERCATENAAWHRNNPEKNRARAAKWRNDNRLRWRALYREWQKENLGKRRAHNALRYARKLKATPPWLSKPQRHEIVGAYQIAEIASKLTRIKHHVDHIEPLRGEDRCGLHVPWNLQIIPASDNLSKGNRT